LNANGTLLIGTQNNGKLIEVRDLLNGGQWDLPLDSSLRFLSLNDFPDVVTVEETGATFAENAVLKASGYALQTGMLTLTDDSGLEVDALGGAPGVFSARYAGAAATDTNRVAKLLGALAEEKINRAARFVSAVAIADEEGQILNVSTGVCEGRISTEPRGEYGFGYDPIFVPNGFELSFAQLGPEIKNRISHRAQALARARPYLERHFSMPDSLEYRL
jgi:XTP/dITP diphosphohydrolase